MVNCGSCCADLDRQRGRAYGTCDYCGTRNKITTSQTYAPVGVETVPVISKNNCEQCNSTGSLKYTCSCTNGFHITKVTSRCNTCRSTNQHLGQIVRPTSDVPTGFKLLKSKKETHSISQLHRICTIASKSPQIILQRMLFF